MHNARNKMAGHRRNNATSAVLERHGPLAAKPDASAAKSAGTPDLPAAPFMLQSGAARFPEDVLIPRAKGAAIIPVPLPFAMAVPGTASPAGLVPDVAAEPQDRAQDRAARRRAAKAATRPQRKARKTAPTPSAKRQSKPAAKRRKAAVPPKPTPTETTATDTTATDTTATGQILSRSADGDDPLSLNAAAVPAVATTIMPVAIPAAAPAIAAASAMAGLILPDALPSGTAPPPAHAEPPSRPEPLPRSRMLVSADGGLVARVVAWLGKLAPRKRRAALPRSLTRLRAPARTPAVVPGRPTPAETASPAGDDTLTRRMLLQLSEENARLRRELDLLRSAPIAG